MNPTLRAKCYQVYIITSI